MNLPEDGRIVVIDDSLEEGVPLVQAFSKGGFPVVFFTEKQEELPKEPLSGIRMVFFDIVLGTEGQPEKSIISTALSVLQRVVSSENGPFMIVTWTKHDEYITKLRYALASKGFQFRLIKLEKTSCKNEEGNYDPDIIQQELKKILTEMGMFHLFVLWGNLIHRSSCDIVKSFSEFYDFDDNWNKKMGGVFLKLSIGYMGKQLDESDIDTLVKNALFSFNSTFIDALEEEIRNFNLSGFELSFSDVENVEKDILGDINSKLLIAKEDSTSIFPGNVYDSVDLDETNIKKADIKELFSGEIDGYGKKSDLQSEARYICLEISPLCDCVQDKWEVSRLVPGVLWPDQHEKTIKKDANFVYKSPLIKFDNKLCKIVLNFKHFTSLDFSELNGKKPLFRIRYPLLVDIQSRLSSHVHRPGVIFVE